MNQTAERLHVDTLRDKWQEAKLVHCHARLHQAVNAVVNEMCAVTDAISEPGDDTLYELLYRNIVPRLRNAHERVSLSLRTCRVNDHDSICELLSRVDQLDCQYGILKEVDCWSAGLLTPTSEKVAIWHQVEQTVATINEQLDPFKTIPESELNDCQQLSLAVANGKLMIQAEKLYQLLSAYHCHQKAQQKRTYKSAQADANICLERVRQLDEAAINLQEQNQDIVTDVIARSVKSCL